MANTTQIFDMASLAEAAYATFTDANGILLVTNKSELIARLQDFQNDGDKDFSKTQAEEFATHYRVIGQQLNTDTGYSATLFERLGDGGVPTGEYVFAQRGTEPLVQVSPLAPVGLDIAVDVGDLVADGLAWSQIVDMYNYWKQLTTPEGQTYQKATLVAAPLNAAAGTYIRDFSPGNVPQNWQIQLAEASSLSGPKVPAGAALEVTGHSLGGHLASAFTRLFSGAASQAYTMNGAGYAEILGSTNIQYVFSQLGGAGSFTSASVQNIRGSAGPDIVTQNAGLVQVGASDQIFIEQGGLFTDNPPLSAVAVFGHSATQITDSAAVYDLFIKLDAEATSRSPGQYLPKLLGIFEAGANTKATSLEEVVRALARTFDVDSSPIATGNREALHARIKLIRDDPDFQSVADQILIRPQGFDLRAAARNDFGALAALIDLSPFSIVGNDATGSAALAAVWDSTRPDDHAAWKADKTTAVNITASAGQSVFGGGGADRLVASAGGGSFYGGTSYAAPSSAPQQQPWSDYIVAGDPLEGTPGNLLLGGVGNDQLYGSQVTSAFARIFRAGNGQTGSVNVQAISTFNNAGFNGDARDKQRLSSDIDAAVILNHATKSIAYSAYSISARAKFDTRKQAANNPHRRIAA